jgi:hypothetical protein
MNKHINDLLGAYHDGELRGGRLRRVEQHLKSCSACQAELDALQELSGLLQISDPDVDFMPAERFAANLALHLPRRALQAQPRSTRMNRWLWVPVSLLIVGVVLQITYSLGFVVSLTANSEVFSSQLAWLQSEQTLNMNWFTAGMNLFGDDVGITGQQVLTTLNDVHVIIAQLAQRLIPQALLAIGYMGWLFFWWLRQQDSSEQLLVTKLPSLKTKNGS